MATRKQSLTVPAVDNTKGGCHCGCAPCDGTCCRLDCIIQPRFFCGQLLTDADLSALVKWSRDRFGLSRYRHGWGVVCGLDVHGKYGAATTVTVTPGYAVDCCGNDIIVCEDVSIDIKRCCGDKEDPCADLRRQLGAPHNEVGIAGSGHDVVGFAGSLRVVDVYIQYDEMSAEPTTALGRGSCKQGTECEYSRTRETYKLTCEPAVAGTDPVRARALKWHEDYEKCLDALKKFRAKQFNLEQRFADVRQWFLRWLDEHPEYGLIYLRERIVKADDNFFKSERNVAAILFALIQTCRNAFLNCACFGCDEDARLPLARVWLLPEDRATGQECRIVTIDCYPPYRRPLQPECWPAPLGSVNVGRYIWHRWDEVCTAVDDLGLNVERRPIALPATLEDLERTLSCDLFVRCDERRVAFVLDRGALAEFKLDMFDDRVIGFCTDDGPPKERPCPKLIMDHAEEAPSGKPISFGVSLSPAVVGNLKYTWKISAGRITSGEGTATIMVDTTNVLGPLDGTVFIEGLDPHCDKTATSTAQIVAVDNPALPPGEDDFTKIDQIGQARAATLQTNGVTTFKRLAVTSVDDLKKLFPTVTEDLLKEWIQKAAQLAS
jgi:hypothetical protein